MERKIFFPYQAKIYGTDGALIKSLITRRRPSKRMFKVIIDSMHVPRGRDGRPVDYEIRVYYEKWERPEGYDKAELQFIRNVRWYPSRVEVLDDSCSSSVGNVERDGDSSDENDNLYRQLFPSLTLSQ